VNGLALLLAAACAPVAGGSVEVLPPRRTPQPYTPAYRFARDTPGAGGDAPAPGRHQKHASPERKRARKAAQKARRAQR
jgi:hypothetical protein